MSSSRGPDLARFSAIAFVAVAACVLADIGTQGHVLSSSAALAQSSDAPLGAPLRLGAPRPSAAPTTPGSDPSSQSQPQAGRDGERKGIEIQTLGAVDLGSVGLLTEEQGGFPADMWAGTERGLLLSLLPRLPVQTTSRAVRSLMRRLLLTAAAAPQGTGESADLLIARVRALSLMGELDAARDLLQAIPERIDSLPLAQARIETALLLRDVDGACIAANRYVQSYDDPEFQKAQILCKLKAQDLDTAIVGLSVLRDSGHADPGFFALMDGIIAGAIPENIEIAAPSAILLTGYELVGAPLPEGFAASPSFGILRAVSASPVADLSLRLRAAEQAEAVGAIDATYLSALYGEIQFKPEDVANALSVAQKIDGPRGRALLFQAVQAQSVPAAQAAVIKSALDLTRGTPLYATMARVFLPFLESIVPSPELSFVAADAGRALIVAGRTDRALQWLTITARRAASADEKSAALSLWALARVAGIENPIVPWDPNRLTAWIAAEAGRDVRAAPSKALGLFAVLESLGDAIPAQAWFAYVQAADRRDRSLLEAGNALPEVPDDERGIGHTMAARSAAAFDRAGETVLNAVLAFASLDPGVAPLSSVSGTLEALVAVGLETEARTLALEASIGRGV